MLYNFGSSLFFRNFITLGTDSAFRCNRRLVNQKLSRFLTTSNPVWNHDYAGEPIGVNFIDPGVNNEG